MFWTGCKIFLAMAFLTGCLYPIVVTTIATFVFPYQAKGSLVIVDGQVRGSELIAQAFTQNRYFWPRPSAKNYNPLRSGGSNLGPTSRKLKNIVKDRAQKLAQIHSKQESQIPTDLIYASGSSLDPHISLAAAYFQIDRIAHARNIPTKNIKQLYQLVDDLKEGRQFTFLDPQYVNVLKLNQFLDHQYPMNGTHE